MRNFIPALAFVLLSACGNAGDLGSASRQLPADPGPPSADARGWVDEARLKSDAAGGAMWLTTGGDAGKTHYSRLDQIDRSNAGRIGVAWEYETLTKRGLEATPIVVDGIMYTSGVLGAVYALDARTGEELWMFQPEVDMQVNRAACCDMVNRGVAVWKGQVYVAALDGMLYALDAANGEIVWQADTIVDRGRGYTSTGAPQIAGSVVVIGNGGAEYDARGYVSAYDLNSGELVWRFFTVPNDPALGQEHPALEMAVQTWDENSRWDLGLGGTVWDGLAYDDELGLVYLGVGNGGPYPQAIRSPEGGDNLFLSSIVALDAKTGDYVWHYQATPSDNWDFTASQPLILADLMIDGKVRQTLMQAPKNGYFFVLDRKTGEMLRANELAYMNWSDGIDTETGKPILTSGRADYWNGPKIIYPAASGAHNWHPMSFDPERGLVYLSTQEMGNLMFIISPPDAPRKPRRLNAGTGIVFTAHLEDALPGLPPPVQEAVRNLPEFQDKERLKARAFLKAFDPVSGEVKWQVETSGWWDRAGVLSTAGGLVFTGSDTGHLNVYDSDTGDLLKSLDIGTAIIAAPMTYELDGVQYVSVMAATGGGGWAHPNPTGAQYKYGNQGRILTFKLDGAAPQKPEPAPDPGPVPKPPAQFGTPAMIAEGRFLFMENCAICHSNAKRSNVANLNYMSASTHEVFDKILLEGLMLPLGMPRWDDALSAEDVKSLHSYLIDMQGETYAKEQSGDLEERDKAVVRTGN